MRHAVLALTTAEEFRPGVSSGYSLEHYGKSVRAFRKLLENEDPYCLEASVVCGIVLLCLALVEQDYLLALRHFEFALSRLRMAQSE